MKRCESESPDEMCSWRSPKFRSVLRWIASVVHPVPFLFSDGILDAFLVAEGLDVIEIVVTHRSRHLFKRIHEIARCTSILASSSYSFPSSRNQIQIALALFRTNPGVLFESVFDSPKCVDRIDAGDAVTNQRTGQSVDNVARRNSVHAFTDRLFFSSRTSFDL